MCGVVGIHSKSSVNQKLYDALTVLQHRGQDAAGIVTCDDGRFHQKKGNGLVKDVFTQEDMTDLAGTLPLSNCGQFRASVSTAFLCEFTLWN